MLEGKWTYRSYHNRPNLISGEPQKALDLVFGEGIFEFTSLSYVKFSGTLDMGSGYKLELAAELQPRENSTEADFQIIGHGISGTPTEGWQYDYCGTFGHRWEHGVEQVRSLVGTVIRTKPHGNRPAGYVASFIAVRHA